MSCRQVIDPKVARLTFHHPAQGTVLAENPVRALPFQPPRHLLPITAIQGTALHTVGRAILIVPTEIQPISGHSQEVVAAALSIRLFLAVIGFCHDFFHGTGGRIIPVEFPFSTLKKRVIHFPFFVGRKRCLGDCPRHDKAGGACLIDPLDLPGKFQIGDLPRFQINPFAAVAAPIHTVLKLIDSILIDKFGIQFFPQRELLCGAALLGHLV